LLADIRPVWFRKSLILSMKDNRKRIEIRIYNFLMRKLKKCGCRDVHISTILKMLFLFSFFYTRKNKRRKEVERIRWPYSMQLSNSTNVSNDLLDIFLSIFPEYRERDTYLLYKSFTQNFIFTFISLREIPNVRLVCFGNIKNSKDKKYLDASATILLRLYYDYIRFILINNSENNWCRYRTNKI